MSIIAAQPFLALMKSPFSILPRHLGRIVAMTYVSLSASAGVVAAQNGIPGYVVLPLALMEHANQASVRAEVNGKRTLLVLDTGATTTLLDDSFYRGSLPKGGGVKSSELPPELKKKVDANGQKAEYAMVDDLKLGGLDVGKRPVVVTDLGANLGQYNRTHSSEAITGLVGEDLLHEYGAIIDWGRRGVYLNTDKSKRLKLGPALLSAGWTAVPMAPTNARHFSVEAVVEGKKVRLIVDTGAQFTTFVPGIVPLNGMMYNFGKQGATGSHIQSTGMTMAMINHASTAYAAKVEHWKIGGFEIASSVVSVTPMPASLLKESSTGEGPMLGLVGAEVLAKHYAIIDVAGSTLYLKH